MTDAEELLELVRAQSLISIYLGGWADVVELAVAPDVFEKLCKETPLREGPASLVSWRIRVVWGLPPGCIVPLDAKGNPIPKPKPPQ